MSLVSAARYLGCFSDRADVQHRALPLVQELSPEMTVEKCLNKCASLGLEYTGLEYKQECYCGSQPPPYEQLLESQCQVACGGGGDGKCGGALSLSVYQQSVTAPTFDAARPLLCLVMILKNEAHTVLNTLRTVKDAIDCWQILDTGSDDGTQKVIQEYFRENVSTTTGEPVPGQLHEEPFVDYGATRSGCVVGRGSCGLHFSRPNAHFSPVSSLFCLTQKPRPRARERALEPYLHADVVGGRGCSQCG